MEARGKRKIEDRRNGSGEDWVLRKVKKWRKGTEVEIKQNPYYEVLLFASTHRIRTPERELAVKSGTTAPMKLAS